jgi:hypothetical protein
VHLGQIHPAHQGFSLFPTGPDHYCLCRAPTGVAHTPAPLPSARWRMGSGNQTSQHVLTTVTRDPHVRDRPSSACSRSFDWRVDPRSQIFPLQRTPRLAGSRRSPRARQIVDRRTCSPWSEGAWAYKPCGFRHRRWSLTVEPTKRETEERECGWRLAAAEGTEAAVYEPQIADDRALEVLSRGLAGCRLKISRPSEEGTTPVAAWICRRSFVSAANVLCIVGDITASSNLGMAPPIQITSRWISFCAIPRGGLLVGLAVSETPVRDRRTLGTPPYSAVEGRSGPLCCPILAWWRGLELRVPIRTAHLRRRCSVGRLGSSHVYDKPGPLISDPRAPFAYRFGIKLI